jgi:hypothetical protein
MKGFRLVTVLMFGAVVASGCSREPAGLQIQTGTDVRIEKTDGVTVSGRLVDVQPEEVVLEAADGQRTRVPRADIRALHALHARTRASSDAPAAPPAPEPPAAPAAPVEEPTKARGRDEGALAAEPPDAADAAADARRAAAAVERAAAESPKLPEYREVQVPAGTVLPIVLKTAVGSATSAVEDQVRGSLRRSISVEGIEVLPAGTTILGTVTAAERSARVKGRARVAFIGGILGGGDGAAKGAAIGGGAGTGVVLSTRGKEVTVPAGTSVSTRLLEPVTIRVRVR